MKIKAKYNTNKKGVRFYYCPKCESMLLKEGNTDNYICFECHESYKLTIEVTT